MKYKAGDKVRVRGDLVVNEEYGGWYFDPKMSSKKGVILTVADIDSDDYYIMDDGSEYWTDEMLEDVDEEFKLPEKWCIKSTKDNIESLGKYWDNGCGLREIYSSKDEFQYRIGKYWCSYNLASGDLLFSDSPGSNHIIKEKPNGLLEITFDQFKKYVLKESESTPVKEKKIVWLNGRWYRILNNWWGKFETIHNSGKRIKFSESITASGKYDSTSKNIDLISEIELLTDLSEIQQYLPENHPDKLKKRTKKVEDLKYPDAVHCSSKEERDLLSKHVSHKVNEWNKDYPCLLIEGGNKSSPYNEVGYIGYVNYEFSDIIFPGEKVVKEWNVGSYAVLLNNYMGIAKGTVSRIDCDYGHGVTISHTIYNGDPANLSKNSECKWFPTLKEAQVFSDELLGRNKIETKPMLSKEELLAEAKRRYPVGTKYKTASDNSSDIFVLSSDDWSDSLLDDVVYAEYWKGCLYYKGDWAEIISKPTIEKEDIDVPEYIECVGGFSDYIIPGLIYKVIDKTHVDSMILRCNITSNLSAGSNLYVSVWSFAFKPSTKEAFDKQGKSSVKKKEELVQTGMSQSQACDSCKYNDNCGEKGFFCMATGGQHYPKDSSSEKHIVAVDPFDAESSLGDVSMGIYQQMQSLRMQVYDPSFFIDLGDSPNIQFVGDSYSDEIYVPIIKTEIKQIKL